MSLMVTLASATEGFLDPRAAMRHECYRNRSSVCYQCSGATPARARIAVRFARFDFSAHVRIIVFSTTLG